MINYCLGIPAIVAHQEFDVPLVEAIADGAGKVCALTTNALDGRYGRKQCNGYKTPKITWFPLTFRVENLEEFTVDLNFWVGVEENDQGNSCIWAGIDGGPGIEICARTPECYTTEVPYKAIDALIEDLLSQLHEAVDKDSVIDTILTAVLAIVLAVIVLAAAAILSTGAGLAIAGFGLGAALVGGSAG